MNFMRGTPEKWSEMNPILEDGQPGFERDLPRIDANNGDEIELNNVLVYLSESNDSLSISYTGKLYILDNRIVNWKVKVANYTSADDLNNENYIKGFVNVNSTGKSIIRSDKFRLKIGDGVTPWNELPYVCSNDGISWNNTK